MLQCQSATHRDIPRHTSWVPKWVTKRIDTILVTHEVTFQRLHRTIEALYEICRSTLFCYCKKINKDGLYALGGVPGFSLKIQNSKKTYVYRYRNPEGRRRTMTLGQIDCVSLSDARAMALSMMQKLSNKVDPLLEKDLKRQKNQTNRTFETVAKQ